MKIKGKYCKVITEYESPFPDPLKLHKGDLVQIVEKETEWKGWIWCISSNGKEGWVPESYLKIQNNQASLLMDYDATELSVKIGEIYVIEDEESGWFFVSSKKGRKGWIPKENVEILIK
jgi:hypothetical protein